MYLILCTNINSKIGFQPSRASKSIERNKIFNVSSLSSTKYIMAIWKSDFYSVLTFNDY